MDFELTGCAHGKIHSLPDICHIGKIGVFYRVGYLPKNMDFELIGNANKMPEKVTVLPDILCLIG